MLTINLLATKYASKDILIAYSHSDMSETSPYGYIAHVNSAVRKELLSSRTLRVSPSIYSA